MTTSHAPVLVLKSREWSKTLFTFLQRQQYVSKDFGFQHAICTIYFVFFFFSFPDLSPNDIQDAVNIFQVKYTPFEEVWARLQEQYGRESKNYSHILRLHINTWTFTVLKYTWVHSPLRYRYHQQWVMNDSLPPK